ncbi:1-phosphatidylinositol-3-phosphate 5-kinase-like protein FAB1 [Calycina marina]|uniref:1-phosphatidylinositol-3-phosphate 5-kinase n=1 Tax=Calycina marina TaxID=1763456 RepID=A0A9P8CJ94_9HELO|nr:1-phosphatidylinositol-3-phosphate 5-kinase-like protein FAB1 [Calycina marina]
MSSNDSPRTSIGPTSLLPLSISSRRGSLCSISGVPLDKEQLSHALDRIHSTACQSNTLTEFKDFAPPPHYSSTTEPQGITGDIMQHRLSGLYSRIRGAVAGKEKTGPSSVKGDGESIETDSTASLNSPTAFSRSSKTATREESNLTQPTTSSSVSHLQSPGSPSFPSQSSDRDSQTLKSKSSPSSSILPTPVSATLSRPSVAPMDKPTTSSAAVPTVAPVSVSAFKDGSRGGSVTKDVNAAVGKLPRQGEPSPSVINTQLQSNVMRGPEPRLKNGTSRDLNRSGRYENILPNSESRRQVHPPVDGIADSGSIIVINPSAPSSMSLLQESDRVSKRPMAIDRIGQTSLPSFIGSRASSTDRSTAEANPIHTSAHQSVRHETFSSDDRQAHFTGSRIPGTTTNEGAPEAVSARLEQMRKQVLSKEFWMADQICKECFLCNDSFSAFRRKHHCRTCGCIFDSKCTSTISGQRFGVHGTLRVCKPCLEVINDRHDSSGSEESDDGSSLPSFFKSQQSKFDSSKADAPASAASNVKEQLLIDEKPRPLATPMMAIAARRVGDSANRHSLVLDDGPQLNRPGSSRSLKSLSAGGRPPSAGHKRHQSRNNFLGRFKPTVEETAPFHYGRAEDLGKRSRLPAFHDDNIIDPELAPYMSDEESSAEEQPSIFATMSSGNQLTSSFNNDRSGFGSLLTAGKKHRMRGGDKSVSGVSFTSKGAEDASVPGFPRTGRRRNLSSVNTSMLHSRSSPRQFPPGFESLDEELAKSDISLSMTVRGGIPKPPSILTRSDSMTDSKAPSIELNAASLQHVHRLLRQLLEDAQIPNVSSWEKALIPILLRCTDDVHPDLDAGDDIDIRHFVKTKKVPGGNPGDTAYVSGVVFTKNLALKSMPRRIANPRIVIVSFPIEYQRHQHHFMSLDPVIQQEKEFLKNMVNRIASMRPQLLLVQKNISGLALQCLAEANIAVAYNVKQSVIAAVSRFAQTQIISSIDMVALKPVHTGKCAAFDVKTYVHKDIPGRKKTYIYLSGCPRELGCTIVLRGADMNILSRVKRITDFMVFVVYNLKLETCLMRDEFVVLPSLQESRSTSPSRQVSQSTLALIGESQVSGDVIAAAIDILQDTSSDSRDPFKDMISPSQHPDDANINAHEESQSGFSKAQPLEIIPKIVSAHKFHKHNSQEDQLPDDIPMPTFYSDMVSKHQTKILSASPLVKFNQPYLLMRAREQERRLLYLKKLRDRDIYEEDEKSKPQKFQLIQPDMVHGTVKNAPRQVMEVLHAVHDAEYDKAMHNYRTQKRQWENQVQINNHLFDPYAHQNITVLYSVVCTNTKIPCSGPDLIALSYYNERDDGGFLPDCTLGTFIADLCTTANNTCMINGCERKMHDHHRTYVHGEASINIHIQHMAAMIKGYQEEILMWSFCKVCKKESQVMPMSDSTWRYSLGKYLELSFWSSGIRLDARFCPHDLHRDHLRYFGYKNVAAIISYEPVVLWEIVVPRARITWKVDNDLKLKNDLYTKIESRWNRFMNSVKSRISGINVETITLEKVEACKAEVERLNLLAQEQQLSLIQKLQDKYMESKYYEVIPMNRAVRAMQEKVFQWDDTFTQFEHKFFPSERDISRLAQLQLKKMFIDRDEQTTTAVVEGAAGPTFEVDEKSPVKLQRQPSSLSPREAQDVLSSVVDEDSVGTPAPVDVSAQTQASPLHGNEIRVPQASPEGMEHLDLAISHENNSIVASSSDISVSALSSEDDTPLASPAMTQLSGTTEPTLSERVEQLRRAESEIKDTYGSNSDASSIPRPSERGGLRRPGVPNSPPMNRTQSQPAGTLRRVKPGMSKTIPRQSSINREPGESFTPLAEPLKSPTTEGSARVTEKKFSERLGLSTLRVKKGHSFIPRRKDPHVSSMAKHFEELSREFEKERVRDRKQRAAKFSQSRALPKASSKPIVEIYKDVNDAVEERGPVENSKKIEQRRAEDTTTVAGGLAELNTNDPLVDTRPSSPTDTAITAEETATETETEDKQHDVVQTGSEDDELVSDAELPLLNQLNPDAAEMADRSDKPGSDVPLDLRMGKQEKNNFMKILTSFWAERSASGWTTLDFPFNSADHIFADMDVIIREDEPSSLIAFALQTPRYQDELAELRRQKSISHGNANVDINRQPRNEHDVFQDGVVEPGVETSLLRDVSTHISLSFNDGSAVLQCKIFYAEQFDALRRKCGVADRIVESLSRCLKWDSKGGKTKSVFLKTLDDRLILKSLSSIETQAFINFAPAYFRMMSEILFHELPSVIAKMLGFYQIILKNPNTGLETKLDVLVMENLFYDRVPDRIFDLKGSMRNRKIESTGEQNEVLLDENMVDFIYESPLFTRDHSKNLLRKSVFNDTLFLQRNDVMDYSLMLAFDEVRFSCPCITQHCSS